MKFKIWRKTRHLLCAALFIFSIALRAKEIIDPSRISAITAMLPAHAQGVGRPVADREAWKDVLARHPDLQSVIRQAIRDASRPLPAQPDSLYLEFSRDGNRNHWQDVAESRRGRIAVFTLAECLENKGRFIAPLEQTIDAICAEPTWVLPAHDGKLQNFYGKTVDIELGSSTLAADLATADYLMSDRLSPRTRELIRENLKRRIFDPYEAAMDGDRPEFHWMRALSNNWNAVCYDGVTAAGLAMIDSAEQRARYIAVVEKNIGSYLDGGFTPDGYCVEGLGYWNYGFGNFIFLAENIRESTGGKIDLMSLPDAVQPALFGIRSEILNGVHLSIADCNPNGSASPLLMNYLCRRFNLNLPEYHAARISGTLYQQVVMAFLPSNMPTLPMAGNDSSGWPWRTWFPDAGILVCRPGLNAQTPFAVAIKGGNNGVNHGHNDVGSFSVVLGTKMVICDPGGEVYTARTFSSRRYEGEVLNSFGHAVPIVAGQLQRHGTDAKAAVLATNFTANADEITFDLSSAYDVPGMQKLERTFVYQRGRAPSLTVHDEAAFASPENFESVLVTWGEIHRTAPNELTIVDGSGAVRVKIDTHGAPFHLRQETIEEDTENGRKPVHLGIVLDDKVSKANVTLRISPADS